MTPLHSFHLSLFIRISPHVLIFPPFNSPVYDCALSRSASPQFLSDPSLSLSFFFSPLFFFFSHLSLRYLPAFFTLQNGTTSFRTPCEVFPPFFLLTLSHPPHPTIVSDFIPPLRPWELATIAKRCLPFLFFLPLFFPPGDISPLHIATPISPTSFLCFSLKNWSVLPIPPTFSL